MATKKKEIFTHIPPPTIWCWYIRKKGFLQPVPYKHKLPDLKPVKEYANEYKTKD